MRTILYAKYEKSDVNKVRTKKCQQISTKELEKLLALIRKFGDLFNGKLGTWNTTMVYLELRDDAKPV